MNIGDTVIILQDMNADWPDRFLVPEGSRGRIIQLEETQPDVVRVAFDNGDMVWVRTELLRDNPPASGDTKG